MSIRRRPDRPAPNGRAKYEVRYREGGRERSRTFTRRGDAEAFDLEVKRRKQLGPLAGTIMFSQMTQPTLAEKLWRVFSAAAAALICDLGVEAQKLVDEIKRISDEAAL